MTEKLSQQELESYLWGAAVLLRGLIDPGDYKSIIFPLMFFKRLSDAYDEEYADALKESGGDEAFASFPENHTFNIPKGSHWSDVRQVTKDVGKAIKNAMDEIEKANPDKLVDVFGDTQWTNKDRLSDKVLIDLIEHFSSQDLSVKRVSQDEFGNAYEFLIKKFADDSGHTAAEFYTNRTVARLMTLIVNPKSGDLIYDPTCGSGGLLLDCINLLKEKKQEFRNVKVYGQEINIITSSIARINMFIHGVEDFHIHRGDTLTEPYFVENDKVKQFDIVMANPPYSVNKWNRNMWMKDPWDRNIYGTPPQGCADYAFFQHIVCSMKEDTGRCAILWPHGILFRDSELSMRSKLVEDDIIDCIIGLGKNLFYNSVMESCIVICRKNKPKERKGKILFINGVDAVSTEKAQSFLSDDNIKKLFSLYNEYKNIEKLSYVASIEEIKDNDYNLNIPLYVEKYDSGNLGVTLKETTLNYIKSSNNIKNEQEKFKDIIKGVDF